ncbi:hypothetical protein [Arcanobacterium buesumense]|uniref:Uncharacterized protein n=1 Tax=Arcanobacterium buesumense TaxID=2722751 RepID=A0A6H2ELS3_9ACTO|nr:hypothetical protein [Arcanobacterium buesumense]QJC22025.1 hypothetical protein HC352_05590 [Arcanobacterium buesumense]
MNTENLMNQYLALKEASENIKQQMEIIKQQLGQALPEGGKVSGHNVTWTKPRLNTTALAKDFTPETNPELYKQTIDSKAVSQHLAPAVLDKYRTGTPTITIR